MARLPVVLLSLCLAAAALCTAPAGAQPRPVEGTDMVPNEYGTEFPREIIWEADGAPMVLVPYGTFRMGLDQEKGGLRRESPEHEVHLPSFYIDKYEVSNRRYETFRAEVRTVATARPSGHELLTHPDHPVVGLPWGAAQAYARWAQKELPTEAMWEKAARGPENTLYTTGAEPLERGSVIAGGTTQTPTVPVDRDTGDVSGYGAFHMGGNASEWTRDWFLRDAYGTEPRSNPAGPSSGEAKSVRGGSYLSPMEETRATFRQAIPFQHIRDQIGFRTVWVPRPVERQEEVAEAEATPTPVPTPSRSERLDEFRDKLRPYLTAGDARLPREMMAGSAHTGGGTGTVQFVNFTPYRLSLNFVSLELGLVFKYDEPLPPMNFRNVELTQEVNLQVLAWAKDAPRDTMLDIGFVRAESRAIVVIPTEFFGPIVAPDGTRTEPASSTTASQYYGDYQPLWNQFEVHNSVDVSVLVELEDVTRGSENARPVGEYLLEPQDTLRLALDPRRYRVRAEYIGALDESSRPVEFMLDDRAARRLLLIREDPSREGGVTVITQTRPYLAVELLEARRIPRSRSD